MKTLEELKAKQAKELADFHAQQAIKESLPKEPKLIVGPDWKAPHVVYSLQNMTEAKELFELFASTGRIAPMAVSKGHSAVVIEPLEIMKDEYKKGEIRGEGYAFEIVVDFSYSQDSGARGGVKLSWYAERGGRVLKINAEIEPPYYWQGTGNLSSLWPKAMNPAGKLFRTRDYRMNPDLHGMSDYQVKYGSYGLDSTQCVYLWVADSQECTEFSHALGMLQNVIDNLKV